MFLFSKSGSNYLIAKNELISLQLCIYIIYIIYIIINFCLFY